MKEVFGQLPSGEIVNAYTLRSGQLKAVVTDLGACLVSLWVPDRAGHVADVVLGYDSPAEYAADTMFLGAPVGRNANRIAGADFKLGSRHIRLCNNENGNNLHSGPDFYHHRMWKVTELEENRITLQLFSPHGDQGFPGNAHISVTYALVGDTLHISYDARSDRDTIFNMTNHSYFNLAGHDHPELAARQILCMPARHFTPSDADSIPTGEICAVDGTPMDFRTPKPIDRDIGADYRPLQLANGYDHNFEVFCNPCAILSDPTSGRTLSISTDCPGLQFYSGNFLEGTGKGGIHYGSRSGIALETQFYPDAIHKTGWAQPVFKAGQHYHSETSYRFTW